jgi:8-oxo-dGTP diphosphatase
VEDGVITKAGLIVFRGDSGNRQMMFVRAVNKPHFVLPGGKQEPGETIEEALARELREELDCDSSDYQKLGEVSGHTPDGRDLLIHLYTATLDGEPKPSSEIREIEWMDEKQIMDNREAMTPMTMTKILPFLKKRQYL